MTDLNKIGKKPLIDPKANDSLSERRMILGPTSNINNFNNVKYKWAVTMWNRMLGCTWFPEKTDMAKDKLQYPTLTDAEQFAYDGTLGYLVFLDSINTYNPGQLGNFITAPEVAVLYGRQTFEEALHSKSYEVMLEEICDSAKKEHIYNFWREDEHLLKRTLNLAEHFDNFFKENTLENFSKAIIAMFLLEGLYFYVGFIYFYLLQSRNLMLGSAAMIRFINRDEINHVLIAANVIKAIRVENPGIIKDEDITRLFDEAVSAEKEWWHYIIGDEILGMNKDSITAYIHYLANKRLNMIGFEARYPESKNPFKKLEELADIEGDGILKENMFEAARTSYQQMNTLGGLDDF